MDQEQVEKLEDRIQESIAEICRKLGRRNLPRLPERRTMHLMAKAAVAVYEATLEKQRRD